MRAESTRGLFDPALYVVMVRKVAKKQLAQVYEGLHDAKGSAACDPKASPSSSLSAFPGQYIASLLLCFPARGPRASASQTGGEGEVNVLRLHVSLHVVPEVMHQP